MCEYNAPIRCVPLNPEDDDGHGSAEIDTSMKMTKWLFEHTRPYARGAFASLALITGAGSISAIDPLLMRHLIDHSYPGRHFTEAAGYVVLIIACLIIRSVLSRIGELSGFRVAQCLGQDLRRELLQKMSRLSEDWHERVMLGEKISRFDTDVEQIAQFGSDAANMIARASVLFALNLIIMFRLNAGMTFALLPLLPLFYLVRQKFRSLIESRARDTQEGTGRAIGRITEHLNGMTQLQLLGAGEARLADSVASLLEVVRAQWRQRKTDATFTVAVSSVLALAILSAFEFGVHESAAGRLTIGTIFAFYAYTTRIFDPVSSAMEFYARSQRMLASARRILEVIDEKPSVPDAGGVASAISRLCFGLSLEDVSFRYTTGRYVLRDIQLQIAPAETVAIVGSSGSGKSSLARLFVRLADPSSGHVLIDRCDAADYTLSALRKTISYVPQAPVLFHGTIRDNLALANPRASRRDIETTIAAACLDPVLCKLERGLDHRLQANAAGLSGGEQQRVAIARALLRKSAVLILDESTSALDAATEALVLRSIRRLCPEMTLIVITHRVKALSWIHRFLVLEDGRITGDGDPARLYAESGQYRSLVNAIPLELNLTVMDRINSCLDRLEADRDKPRSDGHMRRAAI